MITVILLNEINAPIPEKKKFQTWVNHAVEAIPEKIPASCCEISISIIDEQTSAMLNETYRQKKGPTNVLSFHYDPIPGEIQESLGDLAICANIVETEALSNSTEALAAARAQTIEAHWAHLTIHGVLHLCGYDHIIDKEADIMESIESRIMTNLGLKDPYQ